MSTDLDATTLIAAYKKWATVPLETITSMRLEMAKFFFSVSTASAAFFLTTWQLFHNIKAAIRPVDLWSLGLFVASIGCALAIFWPITYDYKKDLKIEPKHARTLKRVKIEGLLWMTLWLSATSFAVIATVSAHGNSLLPQIAPQLMCVATALPTPNAPALLILSCQPMVK